MSDLRLLNPQPMETLPEDEALELFVDVEFGHEENRMVVQRDTDQIRRSIKYEPKDVFHAWSYTATFEKGEG